MDVLRALNPIQATLHPRSDDLLARIWQALGTREKGWRQEDVDQAMLGYGKSGHGADAPKFYQEWRWVDLCNYCLEDVRILRNLALAVDHAGEITNGRRTLTLPPWGKE